MAETSGDETLEWTWRKSNSWRRRCRPTRRFCTWQPGSYLRLAEAVSFNICSWAVPKKRWVLKSPDHVYSLDKLLTVFPDALIIRTHRNPIDVVKSELRLTQVLESLFARPCQRDQLAMREVRKIGEISEQITRFQDNHPLKAGQFVDVTYRELVTDPLAVVRRIYDRFDARPTWAVAERMWRLASKRSRYERRSVSPKLADFRLDSAAETPQ